MRVLIILLMMFIYVDAKGIYNSSNSTFDVVKTSKPHNLKAVGRVIATYKFIDKLGVNYIVYSQSKKSYGDMHNKKLYLYHYVKSNNRFRLLRKIYDFQECHESEAILLKILDNSLSVTDLDNDNIAEITFVYRLVCYSDVAGIPMKLMMLENGKKYALRGACALRYNNVIYDLENSGYKSDKSFKNRNFLKFAQKEWSRYNIKEL